MKDDGTLWIDIEREVVCFKLLHWHVYKVTTPKKTCNFARNVYPCPMFRHNIPNFRLSCALFPRIIDGGRLFKQIVLRSMHPSMSINTDGRITGNFGVVVSGPTSNLPHLKKGTNGLPCAFSFQGLHESNTRLISRVFQVLRWTMPLMRIHSQLWF